MLSFLLNFFLRPLCTLFSALMKVYFMVLLVSTWFELIYIYLRKYGINAVFGLSLKGGDVRRRDSQGELLTCFPVQVFYL